VTLSVPPVLTLPFNRDVPVTLTVERSCVVPATSNNPESTIDVAFRPASVVAPVTASVPPTVSLFVTIKFSLTVKLLSNTDEFVACNA